MNTPPDPPTRRTPFEWSLSALRPADADVARPSFMFKAGQASRQKAVWFWRCTAGGLSVLLVVGAVAGFGVVQGERQRAEATLAESRAAAVRVLPPPSTASALPDAETPVSVETNPTAAVEEAPPWAVVAALERRRNILVGGLGLIPDPPRHHPTSPDTIPTYPGLFAVSPTSDSTPAADPPR